MKKSACKFGVVSLLVLSLFTTSSVMHAPRANAMIGLLAFPCLLVGAALEGAAFVSSVAASHFEHHGNPKLASFLSNIALYDFILGVVFLDNQNGTLSFRQLSVEQGKNYNLTDEELAAYNEAVNTGDFQSIFQMAKVELDKIKNPKPDDAKLVMKIYLPQLTSSAHSALNKVSSMIVNQASLSFN